MRPQGFVHATNLREASRPAPRGVWSAAQRSGSDHPLHIHSRYTPLSPSSSTQFSYSSLASCWLRTRSALTACARHRRARNGPAVPQPRRGPAQAQTSGQAVHHQAWQVANGNAKASPQFLYAPHFCHSGLGHQKSLQRLDSSVSFPSIGEQLMQQQIPPHE